MCEADEYFEVKTGLGQGCVISRWLFNIYLDRVLRQSEIEVRGRKFGDETCI